MKLGRFSIEPYRRPLPRPLVTGKGTIEFRTGAILRVRYADGEVEGECAPLPGWSRESLGEVTEVAHRIKNELEALDLPDRSEELPAWLDSLEVRNPLPPSLRFALESCVAAFGAREQGISRAQWFHCKALDQVSVNALLRDRDSVSLSSLQARGFSTVKVKIASADPETALATARAILERRPAAVLVRFDCNQVFAHDDALRFFEGLAGTEGIEYIEEPVAGPTPEKILSLRRFGIPIALDESLVDAKLVNEVLAEPVCDVCVVKPTVWGGFLPLRSLLGRARAVGVDLVVTSALESRIGLSACRDIAAALRCGRACGLSDVGAEDERVPARW
jgi:o-succinylbenzoate synthase